MSFKMKNEKSKKIRQFDEFLKEIQKPKMRELWNNKEDEVLENKYRKNKKIKPKPNNISKF